MNLDQIESNGYYLSEIDGKIQNVAFISLRNSLRSYFNTYKAISYSFQKITQGLEQEDDKFSAEYRIDYIESCCEAITGFHHFVELIIKDILRSSHILLTIDASKKHETLFDLLFNNQIDESKIEKTNEIGFSEALGRIAELIKAEKINKGKYQFILDNKNFLTKLNSLRNRITHRGIFVLKYKALDYLFGKYALPFLIKVVELDEYKDLKLWQYKNLSIEIDPVKELVSAFTTNGYWITKIALLKELGRAAYQNPLFGYSFHDQDFIKRSEAIAKHVVESEFSREVKSCPVCNAKTLVLFDDSVDVEDDDGYVDNKRFVYRIECFCCSFQLLSYIHDLKEMNLPIEDYWEM